MVAKRLARTLVLFLVSLSLAFPVNAQAVVSRIAISSVDTDRFPIVTVNASVFDSNGRPVSGLTKDMLQITEDGDLVDFEMSEISAGTRTVLVLDLGKWTGNYAVNSRTTVREVMQETAFQYVDTMSENDILEVIAIYEQKPIVAQTFTSDKSMLRDAIYNLRWENKDHSYGMEGIIQATVDLANTPNDLFKRVVFLSPGIMMWDMFGQNEDEIAQGLINGNIPLYSVNFKWQAVQNYYNRFQTISKKTNGQFFEYIAKDGLGTLFALLEGQGAAYQFEYRSSRGEGTERIVVLSHLSSGASDSKIYTVNSSLIASGGVDILVNNGEPITLPAGNSVLSIPVHIVVNNLGNREVVNARFQVNGDEIGELIQTGKDSFSATWNISAEPAKPGNREFFIEVFVEDELSVIHEGSSAIALTIEAPVDPLCRSLFSLPGIGTGLGGSCIEYGFSLSSLINIILLLVAIALGTLLFFKRDQVVAVGKDIGVRVTSQVERLTNRLRKLEPKAKLVAIQGIPENARKEFDLYGETPIGRNAEFAKLIFENDNISRLHCVIHEGHSGNWTMEDQESANGTFVNGEKLEPFREKEIETGSIIELSPVEYGGIKFRFEVINIYSKEDDFYPEIYGEDESSVEEQRDAIRETKTLTPRKSNGSGDSWHDSELGSPSDPANQKW